MTVYSEISVIRSSLKPLKSKLESDSNKGKRIKEDKEAREINNKSSVKNDNIEKEILTYKADGTIERISLENKHLVDILG